MTAVVLFSYRSVIKPEGCDDPLYTEAFQVPPI